MRTRAMDIGSQKTDVSRPKHRSLGRSCDQCQGTTAIETLPHANLVDFISILKTRAEPTNGRTSKHCCIDSESSADAMSNDMPSLMPRIWSEDISAYIVGSPPQPLIGLPPVDAPAIVFTGDIVTQHVRFERNPVAKDVTLDKDTFVARLVVSISISAWINNSSFAHFEVSESQFDGESA